MEPIEIKPVLIQTVNRRNVVAAVNGAKVQGKCIVAVQGTAGAGKTVACTYEAAHSDDLFLRYLTIFGTSGLDLLQSLCRELGTYQPPGRRARCFYEIAEKLRGSGRAVFIDEAHRMPQRLLDVVLDLTDTTGCPFVLIGEEELSGVIEVNKRCWSRCDQVVEFGPVTMPDVIVYCREVAELNISSEVAAILHKSSNGDFRLLKRSLYALVKFANAKGTKEIDLELANLAVSAGLKGQNGNGRRKAAGRG